MKGRPTPEQRLYADSAFRAQRKILSRFVLVRWEKDEKEEVWAGKIVLLFCGSVKEDFDVDELASVRYMECEALFHEVGETLKCACPQCATSGSGKEREHVERVGGRELVIAGE